MSESTANRSAFIVFYY